jgi:hypothetical protein
MLNRYGLVDVDALLGESFEDKAGRPAKLPESGFHMYHATHHRHLAALAEKGLHPAPKRESGWKASGGLSHAGATTWEQENSKGKVFVSRAGRAGHWLSKQAERSDANAPEDYAPDDKKKWVQSRREHTPVLVRFKGRQVHPGKEADHPTEPHFRRDTEHSDDHYWENERGHVPGHRLEVWHPHHKEWHPLNEKTVASMGKVFDQRSHTSLNDDPEGYDHHWDHDHNDRDLHKSLDHEDNQ